jgi:hypothetical protein
MSSLNQVEDFRHRTIEMLHREARFLYFLYDLKGTKDIYGCHRTLAVTYSVVTETPLPHLLS